jgi:hypothetical protein
VERVLSSDARLFDSVDLSFNTSNTSEDYHDPAFLSDYRPSAVVGAEYRRFYIQMMKRSGSIVREILLKKSNRFSFRVLMIRWI